MGAQQQQPQAPKPPDLKKLYKQGFNLAQQFTPRMAEQEMALRERFDPQFLQEQQALQAQFGPTQYNQQLQARQILDPRGVATYNALQNRVAQALRQGALDPNQAIAYGVGVRGATSDYLRGGQADPELLRQIGQGIESRLSGNPLAGGNAPAMARAVYTGQRLQALKQQRFQNLAAAQGWQTPEAQAITAALGAMSARGPIQDVMGIQGVQVPSAARYFNPYAGLQAQQFGLQNYQNMLAYNQLGQQGSSNPWMNALQGAGQGATMGSVGGPYGAAGGAITGAVAGGLGYPQLSDARLKNNISRTGLETKDGIPIVEYDFDGKRWRGVLAQSVLKVRPDAVHHYANGTLGVFYSKLGIEQQEVK